MQASDPPQTADPAAEPRRSLVAHLWAAATIVVAESVFSWALESDHGPAYLATCHGLTALSAVAFGFLVGLRVRSAPLALVPFAALTGALMAGPWRALTLGGVALVAAATARRGAPRREPSLVGACTGAGIACALFFAPRVGGLLPSDAPWAEHAGGGLLFALAVLGLPLLLARVPRLPAPAGALAVVVGTALVSALPLRERPSGLRRLPSPSDGVVDGGAGGAEAAHVFLLVLDTVRADHLSVYGYERDTTPELARLVAERENAVVVPWAYANGTWTVPSHASLFTGRLPAAHGAHFALEGGVRWRFGLAGSLPTLAEALGERYATLGTFANNWLRVVDGMGRGFERYFRTGASHPLPGPGEALRHLLIPGVHLEVEKQGARAEAVNEALLSMVEPWSRRARPLFAFANYGDAHGPYAPPPPFRGRFAPTSPRERAGHLSIHHDEARRELLEARYDEELCYLDAQLGRLFEELERLRLLDRSWVFITSDHGEAFGEHGVTEHGTTVHDEVVRVPLLVFPPAGVDFPVPSEPASLVDVAATIAAIAGVELETDGRDLRRPEGAATLVEFYGDAQKAARHGASSASRARAIVAWPHKLVERGGELALFDLARDPGETRDLAAEEPALVEELRSRLPAWGEPTEVLGGAAASDADLEYLRNLGYVGGDER